MYRESERPDLAINFPKAVRFKLASRKVNHRYDEMITLDLAMLNVSAHPIFLHKLWGTSYLELKLENEDGERIPIHKYYVMSEGVGPASYHYVPKDLLISETIELLVGCREKEQGEFDKSLSEMRRLELDGASHDKTVFDRGLFVTWGDACLPIEKPGNYTITAEMANDFVVVSACEPFVKTAVGQIESSSLKIQIEK